MATSEGVFHEMETFLAPLWLSEPARNEASWKIHRVTGAPPENADFILCEPGVAVPPRGYTFDLASPSAAIARIVADHEGKELAIASSFRVPGKDRRDNIIHRVRKQNALFSLSPPRRNVVLLCWSLPWPGEFRATAFLR